MQTALPADLTAATDEEIVAAEAALIAEFDELHDAGSTDIALLTEIAEAIEAVRSETTRRVTVAEETAAARAELAERIRPAVASDDTEEATEAAEDTESDETSEDSEEANDAEAVEADAETEERELVTASGAENITPKAPSASAVRARTVQPEAPKAKPEMVITAAADIPGVTSGSALSMASVANAMQSKARTLSNGSGYIPIATIDLGIENKTSNDVGHNIELLDRVSKPSVLTAAGWCAPSNNLYELFSIDAADGLFNLPTIQITRGGLNVPEFFYIDDAASAQWRWTEEDQGNPQATKPCFQIPCPEFTDYRLEAYGICLTNGNLTDRAFPELTQRFVDLTINKHLHYMSEKMLQQLFSSATPVTPSSVGSSASGSILNAVDLYVAAYRSIYRMSTNAVLEMVLPLWAKNLIRADFALRSASGYSNVTDAQIDEHFAVRGVRPQYVHDWYPIGSIPTQWPSGFTFFLFPSGGYVWGDGGTIDLGVVRDSVLNATNDYTAAWTEQMAVLIQTGPKAWFVNFQYDVSGVTACCDGPIS